MKRFITHLSVLITISLHVASCVKDRVIAVSSISLDQTSLTIVEGESAMLTAKTEPADATDKQIVWKSSDIRVAMVSEGNVKALKPGKAEISAECGGKSAICFVTVTYPAMIDLGLSVKWATCNVGASWPEEFGDYYAWGETQTKKEYSWETYKWCNGSETSMTKYCDYGEHGTVDDLAVLEEEDDVAHVKVGDGWRMPTNEECLELLQNTTAKWTDLNGVNGMKFTSKVDGYTDRWIFLPAAGCQWGAYKDYNDDDLHYGYYWTSSLCIGNLAYYLFFNPSKVYEDRYYRSDGFTIRPVFDAIVDK